MRRRVRIPGLLLLSATLPFTCEQRDPDLSLFEPANGDLAVSTRAEGGGALVGVRVLVDGVGVGRTPLTLSLAPGTYRVAVDTSGFVAAPAETLIAVAAHGTAQAAFALTAGYPRRVVVEEFTNSGCQGCPEFEMLLGAVSDDLDDEDVIVLALHTNIPDVGDPMLGANALELFRRSVVFYAIGGNPSAAIDGGLLPGIPPSEQMVRDSIGVHRRSAAPVDLQATYTLAGSDVTAEVTVRAVEDVPGDLRLLLMTVQTEISYDQPPGSNGQSSFRHVVRDLAPDDNNTPVGDPIAITAGMDETRTIAATLFTSAIPPDDADRLECVVVLQDWSTKRILQSVRATAEGRPGRHGAERQP